MEQVSAPKDEQPTAPDAPKVFLYVEKTAKGEVKFQIGGHDAEVLGLIEFAKFFMNRKLTDQLKFESTVGPKAVK